MGRIVARVITCAVNPLPSHQLHCGIYTSVAARELRHTAAQAIMRQKNQILSCFVADACPCRGRRLVCPSIRINFRPIPQVITGPPNTITLQASCKVVPCRISIRIPCVIGQCSICRCTDAGYSTVGCPDTGLPGVVHPATTRAFGGGVDVIGRVIQQFLDILRGQTAEIQIAGVNASCFQARLQLCFLLRGHFLEILIVRVIRSGCADDRRIGSSSCGCSGFRRSGGGLLGRIRSIIRGLFRILCAFSR